MKRRSLSWGKIAKYHLWRVAILSLSVFFVAGGVLILWALWAPLPDLRSFNERVVTESTKIYDRTGEILLFDIHGTARRKVVASEEISRHLKNATVAIEDAEFYQHQGVKPTAILRALIANIRAGKIRQGGSTITQQVIKNALLYRENKFSRKIKEWVLAPKLEQTLTKEEILSLYLNEVPYGGNIYGVEEAAQSFFGKNAAKVTLAEAAYLAALPQAPTFYSPYGDKRSRLEERKTLVLDRMLGLGFIDVEEHQGAKKEVVEFRPIEEKTIKAPHFSLFVKELLEEKYGSETVLRRGLKVTTSLDWELQKQAEDIIARFGASNEKNFNARNAGLVAIDPKTGDILAMVGSRDYFNTDNDGNFNVTLARRQPGSAFKPFVYAAAFEKGFTPETTVFDLPTQFDTSCDPDGNRLRESGSCYLPANYDSQFRGPVTFREALAQSINIPAIKVLYLTGVDNTLTLAKKMGITTLNDPSRYGLTLVLGGGEVTLLELTSAYGVFAGDGWRNPYRSVIKIEDNKGRIIEKTVVQPRKILPEETARKISSILSDNKARAPAFGSASTLHFPGREVAVKTGTTNDFRDAWIIGYTPDLVVGSWVGNNDNTPMEKKIAGFIVAPLWHEFMARAMARFPISVFGTPPATPVNLSPILRGFWEGGESYFIDSVSGKLATENTPPELQKEVAIKDPHSILYWVDKNNPRGQRPISPEKDSQFNLWETPVSRWVASQGISRQTRSIIPTESDDVHRPEFAPNFAIVPLTPGSDYQPGSEITIRLSLGQSRFPLKRAEFFYNGNYLGFSETIPFTFSFIPSEVGDSQTENTLGVVIYDAVRNKNYKEVVLRTP